MVTVEGELCGAVKKGFCEEREGNKSRGATDISVSCLPLTLVEADDEQEGSDVGRPLNQVDPAQVRQLGLVDLQQL